MKPRVTGPVGAVNTLHGGAKSFSQPAKRKAEFRTPRDPPVAKKPKSSPHTESFFALNNMGGSTHSRSRSSFHGSQDGTAVMDGMGMVPLDPTARPTRSNRRKRSATASQTPAIMGTISSPYLMPDGQDDIEDDADELGDQTTEPHRSKRTTAPAHKAHGRILPDGADSEFLVSKPGAKTAKKRPINVDDDDELGYCPQPKKTVASAKTRELAVRKSVTASLGSKADIPPTTWPKKAQRPVRARVVSAICLPCSIYSESEPPSTDEDPPLYLEPADDSLNLEARNTNGQPTPQSRWLKIFAPRVKWINYSPDSPYVKVNQMAANNENIGACLSLQFLDNEEACEVANWAQTELKLRVVVVTGETLAKTHQRALDKVTEFNNRNSPLKPPAAPSSTASTPIVLTRADGLGFRQPAEYPAPRPPAFRDRMQQTRPSSVYNAAEQFPEPPSTRRSTRSGGNTCNPIQVEDEDHEPEVPRWSKENTDWEKDWQVSLTFQRMTVDKEDIPRLDEGECLNDNLIGFLMRWIFDAFSKKVENLAQRVYVHNTFFYTTLKAGGRSYRDVNYDGVKNWTSKVDLLSYDYVIVPVNEHFHWWMAIICNPGKLDRDAREQSADDAEDSDQTPKDKSEMPTPAEPGPSSDQEMADATEQQLVLDGPPTAELAPPTAQGPESKGDAPQVPTAPSADGDVVDLVDVEPVVSDLAASAPRPSKKGRKSAGPPPRVYDVRDPRIITLDSLGGSHTPAVASLKTYLLKEFEHKRNKVLKELPQQLGMKAVGLPEQDNFNDCGVYLLAYFREFVSDPDKFVKKLLHRDKTDWDMNPIEYRTEFRNIILKEQRKYQNSLGRGKAPNRTPAKTPSKSPVKAAEPAPRQSPVKPAEPAPRQKSPAPPPQPQEPPKTTPSRPPPARSPGQSSKTLRPSSSPAKAPSALPDNDAPFGDEVMLVQHAKDVPLASVEAAQPPPKAPAKDVPLASVERAQSPPKAPDNDEVKFLQKIPDSPPPRRSQPQKAPSLSPPRDRLRPLRPSPMAKRDQHPKPAARIEVQLASRSQVQLTSRPQTRSLQSKSLQNSPASTAPARIQHPLLKSPTATTTGTQYTLLKSPARMTARAQNTMQMEKSPYFSQSQSKNVPVVRNAKLVTSSDDDKMVGKGDNKVAGKETAIDLTEEEEEETIVVTEKKDEMREKKETIEVREKKDASIDLTGSD